MSDAAEVFRLFPELKPLAQQENPRWTFYLSRSETLPPMVTCGRFHYADGALYADAIHIGPDGAGAARTCQRGHGTAVESVWVFFGDISDVVDRVLTRPDAEDA